MNPRHTDFYSEISPPGVRAAAVASNSHALGVHLLLAALIVLFLCPAKGFAQGTIAVTSTATPGQQIVVNWTLAVPGAVPLGAKPSFYLNSSLLSNTFATGSATKGTYKFSPVPGCNHLTVSLIRPLTGIAVKPIPKLLPAQDPDPPSVPQWSLGATPPADPVVASVTSECLFANTSTASITGPDGLITAANRKQLFSDFSPLFLYSYDHNSEEKYAPIDVLTYIQDSTLSSQLSGVNGFTSGQLAAASGASPLSILNPPNLQAINAPLAATASSPGVISTSASPVNLYVEPNGAGQSGDWNTVVSKQCSPLTLNQGCQRQNVGLYARAMLLDLGRVAAFGAGDPSIPTAALFKRYGCTASVILQGHCTAQVIKLEYWQFYGFSHDFDAQGSPLAAFGSLIDKYLADHQGDWCTVQVYVDANWWQTAPDLAIVYVSYYFHGKQAGFDMNSVEQAPSSIQVPMPATGNRGPTYPAQEYEGTNFGHTVDLPVHLYDSFWLTSQGLSTDAAAETLAEAQGLDYAQDNVLQLAADPRVGVIGPHSPNPKFKHPVVYEEWGGHEFWPTSGWSIAAASKHNGLGTYSFFGDAPVDMTYLPVFTSGAQQLPSPLPSADVLLVTLFAGYWGSPQSFNGPPPGPSLHCEWYWDPNWGPESGGSHSQNLISNLELGQASPTTPAAGSNPVLTDSQGSCGGGRPY
jgi:hypothetical protein